MDSTLIEYREGMDFGRGYNRLTGETLPNRVVQGDVTSIKTAAGQRMSADCRTITEVETLHKSLGVEVDAGGSYFGFSASAKVDYVHRCDFSSFSTYVVVVISVSDAFESVDDPKFDQQGDAWELLTTNNQARFRERFGDCFISGLQKGGEYFAIYQLTSTDEHEKESLAIDVHAAYSGGLTSAELNTHIQNATESSHSNLDVQVHVWRQGAITTADLNADDIMATAKQFPVLVGGPNAVPYAVQLQDYKALKGPNDAFDYYQIQQQQADLAELAKKRFEFLELRDNMKFILAHSDAFANADGSDVDRDALSTDYDGVTDAINTMQSLASTCSRDASQCKFPVYEVAKYKLPGLKKKAGGIPVVSLVELRVHAIEVALADTLREYDAYQSAALAEAEPGSRGVLASPEQYAFIISGVKIAYDKPVGRDGYPNAWVTWVTGQEPATGDVGTGAQVLLNVKPSHTGPPH